MTVQEGSQPPPCNTPLPAAYSRLEISISPGGHVNGLTKYREVAFILALCECAGGEQTAHMNPWLAGRVRGQCGAMSHCHTIDTGVFISM